MDATVWFAFLISTLRTDRGCWKTLAKAHAVRGREWGRQVGPQFLGPSLNYSNWLELFEQARQVALSEAPHVVGWVKVALASWTLYKIHIEVLIVRY